MLLYVVDDRFLLLKNINIKYENSEQFENRIIAVKVDIVGGG